MLPSRDDSSNLPTHVPNALSKPFAKLTLLLALLVFMAQDQYVLAVQPVGHASRSTFIHTLEPSMPANEFRLIAPPTTPFNEDGSLNLAPVEKQAQLLIDTTVDGVFVAGSTGEGQSLSTEERMQSAQRWMDVASGTDLEVIIQVGHNSLTDAIALAAHAQRIGADSIAASSPCYFKPARLEELIDFLVPVAAAASDLPFYFYEIPPLTNVALPMAEFLERAKPQIPNLVGLKYSNIDLMQMQQCVQLNNGEFEVLFGSDQQLLSAVALGACGAVGSTYNFAAPLYRRMLAAFAAGDHEQARQLQAKSVEIVAIMARYSFLSACKILLTELGVDNGPVRAPLRNLTSGERDELLTQLRAAGVFELQNVESNQTIPQSVEADTL